MMMIIILSKKKKKYSVKVTIFNTNSLQLYGINYSYQIRVILNRPIRPIDETLIDTTTPSQGGTGSNGNEGVLITSQVSTTRAPVPDAV